MMPHGLRLIWRDWPTHSGSPGISSNVRESGTVGAAGPRRPYEDGSARWRSCTYAKAAVQLLVRSGNLIVAKGKVVR